MRRLVLAWLALLLAQPLHAQPAPADFVARVEAGLREARAIPDGPARWEACAAVFREAFDRAALAEATAAARWDSLSPAQRTALEAAIGLRFVQECRPLMARPDPGSPSVARVRETPAGLRVTTQFPAQDATGSVVTWTLAPGGPWGLQARDVVADGRGLVAALKGEFDSQLATHGGDADAAIAGLGAAR